MRRRHQNPLDSARDRDRPAGHPLERWRAYGLGSLVALAVATPLLPSEAAPARGTHVVLVMLWWVLLLGWFVAGLLHGRLQLRLGATAAALLAFVTWHSFAAWWMAPLGQPRATWNLLWLWLSFAICFFLARQLLRTATECRALVAVLIALAVGLSVHGYYQFFHSMPETRREFLKNPAKALADAGVYAPLGTPDRRQFEDRLRSSEPMATFILANSLAGFLSPWLLVVLGIAATSGFRSEIRPPVWIAAAISSALISGCWILTKSRSAWLATSMGLDPAGKRGMACRMVASELAFDRRRLGGWGRGHPLRIRHGWPGPARGNRNVQVVFLPAAVLAGSRQHDSGLPLVRLRTGQLPAVLHGV